MDLMLVLVILLLFILSYQVFIKTNRTFKESDSPMVKKIKDYFAKINPDYAKIPIQEGTESYTEDKQVITLCLKDPQGNYYSMNTIVYVALHELAHVLSPVYDNNHGKEFKEEFMKLLNKAIQLGIYNPNIPMPPTYCGIAH